MLALQGAFYEHIQLLRQLGVEASPVRLPSDLDGLAGLVLPGGESTTHLKLLAKTPLPLDGFAASGRPILATCAGLVLAAGTVRDPEQASFGWLPVTGVGDAEVLARLNGEPILVRRGRIVGATFHPELTADLRVHRLAFGDA